MVSANRSGTSSALSPPWTSALDGAWRSFLHNFMQDTLIQGSERVNLKFGCCFLWPKTWSGLYCCENDSDGRLSQIWGQNVSSTSLPCLPPSPLLLCLLSWRLRLRRGPSPCHLPQKPAGGKDFSALRKKKIPNAKKSPPISTIIALKWHN